MNSLDYKHYKFYADSTLKGMTKDELIEYIHCLQHNWMACDERLCNSREYAYRLDIALDLACNELERAYYKLSDYISLDDEYYDVKDRYEWREYLLEEVEND